MRRCPVLRIEAATLTIGREGMRAALSVADRSPEVFVVRLRTLLLAVREGVPILVKLAIRKNLGLALRISDLDDARLRRPPMPGPLFEKLAPITRERAVSHEIGPVAIIPAELLSGDILAGHRPAFLLEGTHVAEIPVARQRAVPHEKPREQGCKTNHRVSCHAPLPRMVLEILLI